MDKVQEKSEQAEELFRQGYNCAQAVLCSFAGELGLNMEDARKISSSFGGGMGRMREVCGAVSGMLMAAGLKYGGYDPSDRKAKAEHYKRVQELAASFREANGSIICRELLGLNVKSESYIPEERTAEYYKKRPCGKIIGQAAGIFQAYMDSE